MADLGLPHIYSGKVRDIYDAGDDRLLMVTSDRISAFDVVMDEPIRDKGRVLTAMSAFWFEKFSDLIGGHLIATSGPEITALGIAIGYVCKKQHREVKSTEFAASPSGLQ